MSFLPFEMDEEPSGRPANGTFPDVCRYGCGCVCGCRSCVWRIGAECCWGWPWRKDNDGRSDGWVFFCSAAKIFFNRSVSLSTSAVFRWASRSSASIIFLTRLSSASSARFRSLSSCSTCFFNRAVSASISHWERGSVGGGRESEVCVCRGCTGTDLPDEGWGSCRLLIGIWFSGDSTGAIGAAEGSPLGRFFFEDVSWLFLLGASPMLNTSLNCALKTSRITMAPRSTTTSRPLGSSISTLDKFGSYIVISLSCLNKAIVISGSLCFLLLPSGLVDLPAREHT